MTWGNSEGTKGRCDAKCHNAATPECDCMCGGAYHGSKRNGTFETIQQAHSEVLLGAMKRAQAAGFTLNENQPVLF